MDSGWKGLSLWCVTLSLGRFSTMFQALYKRTLWLKTFFSAFLSAATMVEVGKDKKNPDEFAVALDEALGDFAFPDEFVFDIWGAIGDAKKGRL